VADLGVNIADDAEGLGHALLSSSVDRNAAGQQCDWDKNSWQRQKRKTKTFER
jgi:hypothetical protein